MKALILAVGISALWGTFARAEIRDGFVIKEKELSRCMVVPKFEERDVVEKMDWYSINMGYKLKKKVLLVILDPSGQPVYDKEVPVEEWKNVSLQSRTWTGSFSELKDLEAKKAAARKEVTDGYTQWTTSNRAYLCDGNGSGK